MIKTPRECFGDFGIKANEAEATLWEKTRNPLLAPVLLTSSGNVIMPYYPRQVRQGKHIKGGLLNELTEELMEGTFFRLTEKILGAHMRTFGMDGHDIQAGNFCLTQEGHLRMIDYGISCSERQNKFEMFLSRYGEKLVAEYSEPPINREYLYK